MMNPGRQNTKIPLLNKRQTFRWVLSTGYLFFGLLMLSMSTFGFGVDPVLLYAAGGVLIIAGIIGTSQVMTVISDLGIFSISDKVKDHLSGINEDPTIIFLIMTLLMMALWIGAFTSAHDLADAIVASFGIAVTAPMMALAIRLRQRMRIYAKLSGR